MKKIFTGIFFIALCIVFVACGNSDNHDGEAKTPSGSSIQKGRDYQDVVNDFEKNGFTNIQIVAIDDLITGWLTKDGEVESVSVNGDEKYSADKWYPVDTAVIITYHTFLIENASETAESSAAGDEIVKTQDAGDEVLTVSNCKDFAFILSLNAEVDDAYAEFCETYNGMTVEFEGSIDYIANHSNNNVFTGSSKNSEYYYDVLISYGDYSDTAQVGPTIKIESISSRNLGYDVSKTLPDFMAIGSNVIVKARVGSYNRDTGILTMYYEEIKER